MRENVKGNILLKCSPGNCNFLILKNNRSKSQKKSKAFKIKKIMNASL